MMLSHDVNNKAAALEIQKFCFINGITPKIQFSKLTNQVLYYFEDLYPKGVEGVAYENI